MNRLSSQLASLYFRFPLLRRWAWSLLGLLGASLVFIVVFSGSRVATLPVGWERGFAVSPPAVAAKNISMASRGNFIAVAYEGREGNAHRIYVALSFNGGRSFLAPIVMADVAPDLDHHPNVAISGNGHVAIAWQNLVRDDSNSRLFFSISADMGASWSQPKRLFLNSDMELLPQFYYDDTGRLHLFYHGHRKEQFNLFHATSADEAIFEEPEALARIGGLRGAFFPAICFAAQRIFIVWQGKGERYGALSDDLFFMKSTNYGRSFSSPKKITKSSANDEAPSILLYRDVLYCVYQNNDDKNWAIKMLRGTDYGDKWEERPTNVSQTNASCYSPQILSALNDELVILWYDTRDVKPSIFARKFFIPEQRFSPEAELSPARVAARKPASVSVGGRIIAMWEEAGRVVARYSDIYVDPPRVASTTHAENAWSKLAGALIQWEQPADESGVAGFAVIVNQTPDFIPTVQNVEGKIRTYRVPDLPDGVTYFHIRSVDGAGNYSRTVHYRLQVSRNPLPMPVVLSPTHPEATASPSHSPTFRWSIEEKQRLKGFVYAFAKNEIKKPQTFTTEMETAFDGLEDGRYFFTIAAVDRTNTQSRPATYEIIVGGAPEMSREEYERMAKTLEGGMIPVEEPKRYTGPFVVINLPFDAAKPFDRNSFNALIVPRNIGDDSIAGYSVAVGDAKSAAPEGINQRSNILSMRDLRDGSYVVTVRARYYAAQDGKRVALWTPPAVKRFTILARGEPSPLLAYSRGVIARLVGYRMQVSISLLGVALAIVTIGFGSRVGFFGRLIQFRLMNLYRLMRR